MWGIECTMKLGEKWSKEWTGPRWENFKPLVFHTRAAARTKAKQMTGELLRTRYRAVKCKFVFKKEQ